MTAGSYPKTTIYPYRYATGGSANQLIPMTAVSGGGTASVYAPDGWDIGKAESLHENGGVKLPDLGYLLDEKEGENKVMKKKHLLGVILFFCVVLATIIFALDRMDVISEGVALFINVSLMALYWCIASILNKDPK